MSIASDAAIARLVQHFSTAEIEYLGQSATKVVAVDGWPERNVEYDLSMAPYLSVTEIEIRREEHSPCFVGGTPVTAGASLVKVADLVLTLQLDMWAAYKVSRQQLALAVESLLHNGLPNWPGLRLTLPDYFEQPITVHSSAGRTVESEVTVAEGEFRRTWDLTVMANEVVEQTVPTQQQTTVRPTVDDIQATDTVVTPPSP